MAQAPTRYTTTAIALHWLMALLIVAAFGLGLYMVDLKNSPQKLQYFSWHKWMGVTVFGLAAIRLLWRLFHQPPALPAMPMWQQRAAHGTHILMYVLFFGIPLAGWLYSSARGVQTVYFGIFPLPDLIEPDKSLASTLKQVHVYSGYVLAGLVSTHLAAVVKHQWLDKDGLLKRMIPGR